MDHLFLMRQIRTAYCRILGDNLVGIYLHGSMAFGCATPASDIDFIVVVGQKISQQQKEEMIKTLLQLNPLAPQKGFEMSVLSLCDCQHFCYPTPYQLHYSQMYQELCQKDLSTYCRTMHGVDYDLAAHLTVIKKCGIVVYGDAITNTFGDVPWQNYLDSIRRDIVDARREVYQNAVYVVLNLCRIWAALSQGKVLSKEQGGLWAVQRLPVVYLSTLKKVLFAYRTGGEIDSEKEKEHLKRLVDYLLHQIDSINR